MNSAELVGVSEVTDARTFKVAHDGVMTVVSYAIREDSLHCALHKTRDGCDCTRRVRLSGVLTNSVISVNGKSAPSPTPFIGSPTAAIFGPPPTKEEINSRIAKNEVRAKGVGL